jgi:hypothetical protein
MLSREDIESLGWTLSFRETYYWLMIGKDEYQLYHQDDGYVMIYDYDANYLFRGFIETREELSNLMNWLRIVKENGI